MEHLMNIRFVLGLCIAIWIGPAWSANYPLGTMTCDDIGKFAQQVMKDKKAGRSKDEALAALETRTYGDPVEKNNLTDIVTILYGNMGRNLGESSAGAVMRTDCETGRTK
jgi:hypothetical protein